MKILRLLSKYHAFLWFIHVATFIIVGTVHDPQEAVEDWFVYWSMILGVHSVVYISMVVRDRVKNKLDG